MQYTNGNPQKIERNLAIAKTRLETGKTYRELAEQFNLTSAHISNILNDEQIKDVIETGINHQVSMIPLANQVIHQRLTDTENPKLALDASKIIFQNIGISPTHTLNQTITNIFNQTNNITVDAGVMRTIARYADEDIIDIDLGLDTDDILKSGGDI